MWITKEGYLKEKINGKVVSVHRIVWESQYGPIPNGHVIHHKNGITHDNRIENLECLPSQGAHMQLHFVQEREKGTPANCLHCGKAFMSFRRAGRSKKYCSRICKQNAAGKRWIKEHPEWARAYQKKWQEANPEKLRVYQARYDAANREKRNAKCRAYYYKRKKSAA
jgi:HNH endonuclease